MVKCTENEVQELCHIYVNQASYVPKNLSLSVTRFRHFRRGIRSLKIGGNVLKSNKKK